MDNSDDLPQAKASRQQAKVSHEFCQGYVDKNGIWNNGFYCRRWGGAEETYCCGDGREKFCCPELTSATPQAPTFSSVNYIPIIVGVSVGLVLVIGGLLLVCCFFCPSCPGYKGRRKTKLSRPIVIGRTLSVSMEAEATSAVIAAQALVPLQACASPGQGSSSDDGHLHCGCRWSPTDSTSNMVDIDSIVTSMYQTTSAWQPELDNFYNSFSCDVSLRPNCKEGSLRSDTRQQGCSRLPASSARINSHRMKSRGRQSPPPLGIKAFRTNSSAAGIRESSDESKPGTLERDSHPSSLRRTYGLPDPLRLPGTSLGGTGRDTTGGGGGGGTGGCLFDPERQRRDSGVLVEDQDTTGSGNSLLALNIPTIELTSIGRQLDFSSVDRRHQIVRQH